MKVLIVTGSYPPIVCGVGDYSYSLARSLREEGVNVQILTGCNWSPLHLPTLLQRIELEAPDIVHIQYPALGFGYQLGPQALAIARRSVVTIHEASQAHWLRKLSLYGFAFRANSIVFTSEAESRFAVRWCAWIKANTSIIPIGVNVQVESVPVAERQDVIGYFGLIRPNKGLEQVIELAAILYASGSHLKVRVIGKVFDGAVSYYELLQDRAREIPIDWCIDRDDAQVASLIGSCRFAYLPFPDGASERRASLMAYMESGVCIVSKRGKDVPQYLEDAVKFAANPLEAIRVIQELDKDQALQSLLGQAAKAAAQRFSWKSIAARHVELYQKILSKRS